MYLTHLEAAAGNTAEAMSNGKHQIWLIRPVKNRWLVFSDTHVQKRRLMMNNTYDGIVSMLTSKRPKDSFRMSDKYDVAG